MNYFAQCMGMRTLKELDPSTPLQYNANTGCYEVPVDHLNTEHIACLDLMIGGMHVHPHQYAHNTRVDEMDKVLTKLHFDYMMRRHLLQWIELDRTRGSEPSVALRS